MYEIIIIYNIHKYVVIIYLYCVIIYMYIYVCFFEYSPGFH